MQLRQFLLELLDVLELPVYGGEPDVRHFVDVAQLTQRPLADHPGGHGAPRHAAQVVLDVVAGALEAVERDAPFLARAQQPVEDLLLREQLFSSVALDHHECYLFDAFVRRVAPLARQALPASPDRVAGLGIARVDDFALITVTEWTTHRI